MLEKKISRRSMLRTTGLAVLGSTFASLAFYTPKRKEKSSPEASSSKRPFRICLNISTIVGYRLPVQKQIDLRAEASFEGIELWTRDVDTLVKQGGAYETLKRRLEGSGFLLENMIGFASWFADNSSKRKEGLNQIRHDMEIVTGLDGKFIAAPVQGVTRLDRTRLPEYFGCYRTILDLGDEMGITPILKLWRAGVLDQLSDTMATAIASRHPRTSVLLDFYHLYREGNGFDGLRLVNGKILPVFHINDYPELSPRTELRDSNRVLPGDGICPFNEVFPLLYGSGFRGGLFVELFNKGYWETVDVKRVLGKSFEKTTRVINSSVG